MDNTPHLGSVEGSATGFLLSQEPPQLEFGVDVARYGSCESVLAAQRGGRVEFLSCWRKFDRMETTGRVAAAIRAHQPRWVKVDVVGMGGAVVDRLHELGFRNVLGENVGLPARDAARFHLLKDELAWGLRDWFRQGELSVPEDRYLKEQAARMTYGLGPVMPSRSRSASRSVVRVSTVSRLAVPFTRRAISR